MAGFVGRLTPGESLDPTLTFSGPWHSIESVILQASETLRLDSNELESAIFVERGSAALSLSHTTIVMSAGDAVTLVKGASGVFAAHDNGASLFITRLRVS